MGIFRRISAILRAWTNALVGRMEDPKLMLTTALTDMESQLSEAAGEVGRIVAEHKRLDRALAKHREEASAWEKKAMIAVGQGRDDLARDCLDRQAHCSKQAALLEEPAANQAALAAQMKAEVRRMKARIDEAKAKKTLLEARHASAEAQKTVLQGIETLDARDAGGALGKLEMAVMKVEAEAEAKDDLSGNLALDRQLAMLVAEPEVDDALAALRAKMGLDLDAPALHASERSAVELAVSVDQAAEQQQQIEEEAMLFAQLPVASA